MIKTAIGRLITNDCLCYAARRAGMSRVGLLSVFTFICKGAAFAQTADSRQQRYVWQLNAKRPPNQVQSTCCNRGPPRCWKMKLIPVQQLGVLVPCGSPSTFCTSWFPLPITLIMSVPERPPQNFLTKFLTKHRIIAIGSPEARRRGEESPADHRISTFHQKSHWANKTMAVSWEKIISFWSASLHQPKSKDIWRYNIKFFFRKQGNYFDYYRTELGSKKVWMIAVPNQRTAQRQTSQVWANVSIGHDMGNGRHSS